jgi:phosphotriesterase-related protein
LADILSSALIRQLAAQELTNRVRDLADMSFKHWREKTMRGIRRVKEANTMATVNTVLGPIDANLIGETMSHVHLTIDIMCWFRPPDSGVLRGLSESRINLRNLGLVRRNAMLFKDNLVQDDLDLATNEAGQYRLAGGHTLINCDLPGMGRDPTALQRIARATELNIVASTGWYVQASHPPEIARKSVEELSDIMINEITTGIGNTGVKAGNIGEIAMSGQPHEPFQPGEEKVLRAAARAQKATGVSLTVHPNFLGDHWDTYIDILEKEGANLGKCYMSHLGLYPDANVAKRILKRGVGFVSYDQLGHEELFENVMGPGRGFSTDKEEVRCVIELLEAGYTDRVLLCAEVAMKTCYKAYGGWGYSHVHENIIPWLKSLGASEEQIHSMMVDNPRRLHAVG